MSASLNSATPAYSKYNPAYELQWQIQLGSTLYPEYPVRSLGECFKTLRLSQYLPEYHQHAISITFNDYISDHFIYCQNFERVPQSAWTGINSKSGALLIIKCEAIDKATITGNIAQSMFVTLESENILEIRDSGCTAYD